MPSRISRTFCAIARGENRTWIEHTAGIALVPHAVYYLRAEVKHLIPRVVVGTGAFDDWESGLDLGFGPDMYESFVRYQSRLIRVFDQMASPYGFKVIDATRSADQVFTALKTSITETLELEEAVKAPRRKKPPRPSAVAQAFSL